MISVKCEDGTKAQIVNNSARRPKRKKLYFTILLKYEKVKSLHFSQFFAFRQRYWQFVLLTNLHVWLKHMPAAFQHPFKVRKQFAGISVLRTPVAWHGLRLEGSCVKNVKLLFCPIYLENYNCAAVFLASTEQLLSYKLFLRPRLSCNMCSFMVHGLQGKNTHETRLGLQCQTPLKVKPCPRF